MWRRACRFLAEEEFLAPHSLLLDSMTTEDLYRCATRPSRLRNAILTDTLPPLNAHRLVLQYPREFGWRWHNRPSHLLPGGRWLLDSASDYECVHIFCWDLSLGSPEAPRRPVATIKAGVPGDENDQFQAQYSPIHQRVTVLISVNDHDDDTLLVKYLVLCCLTLTGPPSTRRHREVFHLVWNTGNRPPQFTAIAQITCDDMDGDEIELCDDIVSWYNNTCVTLWNWQSDTWAKIAYSHYTVSDYDSR